LRFFKVSERLKNPNTGTAPVRRDTPGIFTNKKLDFFMIYASIINGRTTFRELAQ
jgi:hypothetical protein